MISKSHQEKYKQMIDIMRELRFSEDQIENKIIEFHDLQGWEAITLQELMDMDEAELSKLKSYCWKEGSPRCECIGITNLQITKGEGYWDISFSDDNGDPSFYAYELTDKIHDYGGDRYTYGLYKKKSNS